MYSPPPRTLSDLVDRQAADRPSAEALTDGRRRLDWAEYADRAARLAGHLVARGIEPGDRVGVHLPKSVDAFVSVHAIVRAGAVVVPIDRLSSPDYVRSVLGDAGARGLLSATPAPEVAALIADTAVEFVTDLTDDAAFDAPPAPPVEVTGADPAYIIFTSGSTGRPKGIVHTHASALAYARLAAATYELGPSDRMANIAPLHFDQSTFELFAGPLAGAAVLVVPDATLRFPASVAKLIADERITVWYSVPFAARLLSERGAVERRDLSALRWLLFGGEAFPAASLARLMEQLPGTRFSNVYGPAETNQCTYFHLDEPPGVDETIPIGVAWDETELVLVDDAGNLLSGPATGELWVASSTVMREYWGAPELTAAALVERDDLGSASRWYRTGDIVRRRPDGLLEFVGRTDNQVKVRGHRIELEAVELALAAGPRVEACSVVVEDGERLTALVTPSDVDTGALLSFVRSRLPGYAVPHAVVGVDTLERTSTGKVDRAAAARRLGAIRAHAESTGGDSAAGC